MTEPHPNPDALFVVLEGIDGSGTTTQVERLTQHLRARGRQVLPTREPSTGPVGRLLRELLLGGHGNPDSSPVEGRTMALLFAADRRDHLNREIEPALLAGTDVVSDRYVLSSLAYQAEEADLPWVCQLADGIRVPDLTLLLDLPIAIAAERRRRAVRVTERYDADRMLERVSEHYRRLASGPSGDRGGFEGFDVGRIVVLDGSGSVEDVGRAVAAEVGKLVGAREQDS